MMLFLTLFVFGFCVLKDDDYVLSEDIINTINNDPTSTWTAGMNPFFAGRKWKDVKRMFRKNITRSRNFPTYKRQGISLPEHFNVYKKWPDCKHYIRYQGICGSCWAMSATEAMSDRFCIYGKDVVLSPQDLLSCDKHDDGCYGDEAAVDEWLYFEKEGAVTEDCFEYVSGGGGVPKCPYKCDDQENWNVSKHYSITNSTVNYEYDEDAMESMLVNGSIQAGLLVFEDFVHYQSGVYSYRSGKYVGGHAIKILGWGNSHGTKYWIGANSWGEDWGMDGYFWIKRGVDECGIEDELYSGIPLIPQNMTKFG